MDNYNYQHTRVSLKQSKHLLNIEKEREGKDMTELNANVFAHWDDELKSLHPWVEDASCPNEDYQVLSKVIQRDLGVPAARDLVEIGTAAEFQRLLSLGQLSTAYLTYCSKISYSAKAAAGLPFVSIIHKLDRRQRWNPTAEDLNGLEEHSRRAYKARQKTSDLGHWVKIV